MACPPPLGYRIAGNRLAVKGAEGAAEPFTLELIKIGALNVLVAQRGNKLSQMALQWALRDPVFTSALIGTSRPNQMIDNV